MPTNTITDLGQYGYLPDVAPNIVPVNGFTFSRNWRFNEANFVRVSEGYRSVFMDDIQGGPESLGDTTDSLDDHTPNATFLYNWLLGSDESNTSIYYDTSTSRLRVVDAALNESTNQTELRDRQLSPADHVTGTDHLWQATDAYGIPILNNTLQAPFQFIPDGSELSVSAINAVNGVAVIVLSEAAAEGVFRVGQQVTVSGATQTTLNRVFNITAINDDRTRLTTNFNLTNDHSAGTIVATPNPTLTTLENWPGEMARCQFLTSYASSLVAIGYTNSGATDVSERGSARVIAFSDTIVTPGTFPEWDFSNVDSNAQLIDLSLITAGDLISAYEQNGSLFVNTTTNVIQIDANGDGTYRLTLLPFPNGVLTNRASCPIPNGFFNIGNRRIYIHDGTSATPLGEGTWVETWFEDLDQERIQEVQCVYDPRTTSVWIKTPTGESTQEIWIYNLKNNTLSPLDDHNEIEYIIFSANGVPTEAAGITWDSIDSTVTWDTLAENQWEEFLPDQTGIFRNRLLSVGGNQIFVHDSSNTYNGRNINAVLRKEYFKPEGSSSYGSFRINELIPHALSNTDGATLDVRIGSSNNLNNEITYGNYRTFNLENSRKLDFRGTKQWGAIEFRSFVSGLILSSYQMELTTVDRR